MVIRAEGRMKVAMGIMAAGAIINIILDPIFILLMPSRGPQAVAVATVFSQLIQALVTLIYFLKKSPVVRFHGIKPAKDLVPEIFSVGMSAMLMQIMMLVQMTVVYNTAVQFGGEKQIALMGAAQRVMQLAFVPIWGMSQGMQPAVGTNFGAKEFIRVKKLTNVFIIGSTCLAGFFFVIIEIFSAQILSAFITNISIVNVGLSNFRLMLLPISYLWSAHNDSYLFSGYRKSKTGGNSSHVETICTCSSFSVGIASFTKGQCPRSMVSLTFE